MKREGLSRIAWFVAYWLAGVTIISIVAWMIKSVIM